MFSHVYAQEGVAPIIIRQADRWEGTMAQGQLTTRLVGNVVIYHDSTLLYSDEALYYKDLGKVEMLGHVKVVHNIKTLTARKVLYFAREKKVVAEGNILLTEGKERTSQSQYLTYYVDTERMMAKKDVVIKDFTNHLVITGGYGEFTEGKKYGYLTERPVLTKTDSTTKNLFQVTCKKMELYSDSQAVVMNDSVVISQSGYTATCATARFYDQAGKLVMVGSPSITSTEHALLGDTMTIYLKNFKMERLLVNGHAKETALRAEDSLASIKNVESELSGKEIALSFKDEHIDTAYVKKNAVSIYYEYTSQNKPKGRNEVSGSTITLVWDVDSFKRAQVTGGAAGGYYPRRVTGN